MKDDDEILDQGPDDDPAVMDLLAEAPSPAPDFQEALATQLADIDPGWGPRPEQLWSSAIALVMVGVALLIIGALLGVGGI